MPFAVVSTQTVIAHKLKKAASLKGVTNHFKAKALDDRFDHIVKERIEDHPHGYPRLAALLNSDSGFVMYRRFGYLHSRILLHRQAEIVALERKLDELDKADVENDQLKFRLQTRELLEGDDTTQKSLIDDLEEKLKNYDELLLYERKLRSINKPTKLGYRSMYNYMWERKPLMKGEDDFLYRRDDFVSLAGLEEESWLDELVARLIPSFHGKLLQTLFSAPEDLEKTTDKGIEYYSDSRLATFIKMLVALFTVALLMIPVWLLILVDMSATLMLVTVLLFVCAFLAVLSLFTAVKRQEVFFGGAAYCAVLVVFLGSIKSAS